MILQSRRKFLTTLTGIIAAPAVIKADALMRVRSIVRPGYDYATFISTGSGYVRGDFTTDDIIVKAFERISFSIRDRRDVHWSPGV